MKTIMFLGFVGALVLAPYYSAFGDVTSDITVMNVAQTDTVAPDLSREAIEPEVMEEIEGGGREGGFEAPKEPMLPGEELSPESGMRDERPVNDESPGEPDQLDEDLED